MTYQQLLEELEDMTDDQLKQSVCVSVDGEYTFPEVITVVKKDYSEGEEGSNERFAEFQTILM